MFEFGRDLRKLFTQARESEDLSWLELIGVDLLAGEARQQTTDAGRVSCAKPHAAWLRASALWREHARRAGAADSLDRALKAAHDAARLSRSADETARATIERAQTLLLRFDLCGGPTVLDQAAEAVPGSAAPCRPATLAAIAAVHARIRARQARLSDRPEALMDAAALLDASIHGLKGRPACELDDIRMDRAALALEAGVARRDPHLLDQAGRELQGLVQAASPDYRPLTRARALTLCGAGLSALAVLAEDNQARVEVHSDVDRRGGYCAPQLDQTETLRSRSKVRQVFRWPALRRTTSPGPIWIVSFVSSKVNSARPSSTMKISSAVTPPIKPGCASQTPTSTPPTTPT